MIDKLKKNLNSSDSYVSMALGLAVVLLVGVLVFNYFQRGSTSQQANDTETSEQGATGSTSLPTTHTVTAGETLWTIAEKYYNSGYNWVDIQKANNLADANAIENGQNLTIPAATPILTGTTLTPTPTPTGDASGTSSDLKSYTVAKGDFLWKIAVMQYGNGYKWVDIARANKLVNPNVIHTGNVLILP